MVEANLPSLHIATQLAWAPVSRGHLSLNELLFGKLTKHLSNELTRFAQSDSIVDVARKNSRTGASVLGNLLFILWSTQSGVED